jgi:hypothetical protein
MGDDGIEQRGLSDAGTTAEHEHAARTVARIGDELIEHEAFGPPSSQSCLGIGRRLHDRSLTSRRDPSSRPERLSPARTGRASGIYSR